MLSDFKDSAQTGERGFMIQNLDYHVQPVSDDIYGQRSYGYLSCKGCLSSLRCFKLAKTGACQHWLTLQGLRTGHIDFDVDGRYKIDELYFMPVLESRHTSTTEISGLVLVPTINQSEYRRVCFFSTKFGYDDRGFLFRPPTYPRTAADRAVLNSSKTLQEVEGDRETCSASSASGEPAPEQTQCSTESSRIAGDLASLNTVAASTDVGQQSLAPNSETGDEIIYSGVAGDHACNGDEQS